MLESVKIARRQSEIRQALAGLINKTDATADELRAMEAMDLDYRQNETRFRAALITEDTERREAGADLETRSSREFADLMGRFELRQVALALDEGRALDGATAEVVQELRSKGGYRGVPVPWAALEQRAGETVASGTPNPLQTRPIIDRLFPASVDRRRGVRMLWGGNLGALEIRSEGGATRLRASFPYGAETELAPGRREIIAPRAFAARIEAGEDIHLLSGHAYEKPLASRAAGTLTLRDTDGALEIEASVDDGTSWARDFLAAHASGLIRGLSPGFRVPTGGEKIERRGRDLLRTITMADLFEISAVTVPAYPQAQIEARAWGADAPDAGLSRLLNRWRL